MKIKYKFGLNKKKLCLYRIKNFVILNFSRLAIFIVLYIIIYKDLLFYAQQSL